MSIATEISRLLTAKANIKSSIEAKGVTVPSSTTLDGYHLLINQIPTGGGGGGGSVNLLLKTVQPSGSTQTITPDTGYDGLSQVTVNPALLQFGVIRPDAELIKTYTEDVLVNEDLEITIPSYTTSATSLRAGSDLSPTVTIDLTNYDYYVVVETLTIPSYSITTVSKGRVEYHLNSTMYEIVNIEAGTYKALINPEKSYASALINPTAIGPYGRLIYYSSGSAVSALATSTYGTYLTATPPFASSSTLTIKSTNIGVRGSTSYFTNTYFNAVTDIRVLNIIKVYRAPRNNYNIDSWGLRQNVLHIVDCANSSTHTLT